MSLDADFPSCAGVSQSKFKVRVGKGVARPFRPLNQADSFAAEIFSQTRISKLTSIEEPIKIKVVQV